MLCLCGLDRLHRFQEKEARDALKGRLREKQKRMTMFERKTYGILAAALLLLSACAKVNDDRSGEQMPVTFSTYGLRPTGTKADASYVAPGADFAAGSVVGLYGFYHDDSEWSNDPSNIADFMYHTALTKQDDGTWTYSPVKYWPNEYGAGAESTTVDKLSFWGYYPREAAGLNLYKSDFSTPYDNDTPGLPKVSFTQKENPDEMIDLMFSQLEKDLTKPGISESVTLHFRHALALVEFQLAEGTGAKINNLTLTKIKKTGKVEDCSANPIVWTGVEGLFNLHRENVTVEGNTLLSILAIPQTLDADASFTLNYDITFASSDPSHPDPIVYKGDSFSVKLFDNTNADPAKQYGVTAWQAGKHYIYKISAGLDRIEFEEIVESADDWSVGNNNISVPE